MSQNKEEKQTLPDNYYKKVEKDWHEASELMKEGTERAKTSRIDVVGQNGNDGEHYDDK